MPPISWPGVRPASGRHVSAVGVEIGTADALVDDADYDFALARFEIGFVDQTQGGVSVPGRAPHDRLRPRWLGVRGEVDLD